MRPIHARVLLAASVFSVGIAAGTLPVAANGIGPGPISLNWLLRGAYAFTGTTGCLYAPGSSDAKAAPGNTTPFPDAGFNSSNQPVNSSTSFSHSNSVEGTRTFNGDGTGSVNATEMGFTGRPTPGPTGYPAFPPSAEAATISYQFTYTVNPDGSWTSTMVPGSFAGTFVSGPRNGQTFTTTIPQLSGLIGSLGQTLTAEHPLPTVELQIFSNGDAFPRICHRSRVFTDRDTWSLPH